MERVLAQIGESTEPPPSTPARGPRAWGDAPELVSDWHLLGQPEVEFEQRVSW